VWINVAKAIAGLTVTRAIGADGKEIDPVADTTDGIISCAASPFFFLLWLHLIYRRRPVPFTCTVAPRTPQVIQLVLDATADAP
jgi:hypothetical protein